MTLLHIENLRVVRRDKTVLDVASLAVRAGECVALIGPNGAGKSTLLRAALGLIPAQGRSNLAVLDPKQRAKAAAFLPQTREIAWPVTVETIASLGRPGASSDDRRAVEAAMVRADVADLRARRADRLSGGEQARVLLARALAQDAPLLLADEPTAGLDPARQIETMETFAALAKEEGRAVVVSLHDLGLAARWCSRVVVLDQGCIVADGAPDQALTPEVLAQTYGVRVHLENTPDGLIAQPLARI